MNTVVVPIPMLIFLFVLVAGTIAGLVWVLYLFFTSRNTDIAIFIDKNNRWDMVKGNFKGVDKFNYKNRTYFMQDEVGLLNSKGKVLFIFSENKPTGMRLSHSKADWLDSQSIMAILNNEFVKQIVKPQDKFKDTLLILGAIGGMIAGVSSMIILLIQAGVIKVG